MGQGLLDVQPGLAAAAARNQDLAPVEAEVAATTADGARLQQETVTGLQQMNTELTADRVMPLKVQEPKENKIHESKRNIMDLL